MSPTSSFLCLHFSELPQRLPHLVRTHGQCCNGKEKPLASGICLCGLLEHTPLPKAEGLPPAKPLIVTIMSTLQRMDTPIQSQLVVSIFLLHV